MKEYTANTDVRIYLASTGKDLVLKRGETYRTESRYEQSALDGNPHVDDTTGKAARA